MWSPTDAAAASISGPALADVSDDDRDVVGRLVAGDGDALLVVLRVDRQARCGDVVVADSAGLQRGDQRGRAGVGLRQRLGRGPARSAWTPRFNVAVSGLTLTPAVALDRDANRGHSTNLAVVLMGAATIAARDTAPMHRSGSVGKLPGKLVPMSLPLAPPLSPMLSKAAAEIPDRRGLALRAEVGRLSLHRLSRR